MCLLRQEEIANAWTLICDPHRVAQFLTTTASEVTIVKFKVNKFLKLIFKVSDGII